MKRKDNFWRAFLFTKDGAPKSSYGIYTFCLSIFFMFLYLAVFAFLPDMLKPITDRLPVTVGNLTGALLCSMAVLPAVFGVHRISGGRRLVLGAYLWISLYAVAVLIAESVILGNDRAAQKGFLVFFLWFILIPAVTGLAFSLLLCRKEKDGNDETKGDDRNF